MDLHMAECKRHRSGNWPGRLQRYSLRRACVEGAGSQWGTYAFFERRAQRAVDRVVDGCRERIERNTGRDAAWRHPDSAFPYRRRPYVRGYYADTDVLRSKDPSIGTSKTRSERSMLMHRKSFATSAAAGTSATAAGIRAACISRRSSGAMGRMRTIRRCPCRIEKPAFHDRS